MKVKDGLVRAITFPCRALGLDIAAEKVIKFVKKNWVNIIAFLLAWGAIIGGMGTMYGFQATAIPLAIGLGCGMVPGLFIGVITAVWLDPLVEDPDRPGVFRPRCPNQNTFWNALNSLFFRLDANGTRMLVLSVAVTVVMAAAVHFPTIFGAAFGIMIGDQLAVKIGHEGNVGDESADVLDELTRAREDLEYASDQQQRLIDELQKQNATLHAKLGEMDRRLDAAYQKEGRPTPLRHHAHSALPSIPSTPPQ